MQDYDRLPVDEAARTAAAYGHGNSKRLARLEILLMINLAVTGLVISKTLGWW